METILRKSEKKDYYFKILRKNILKVSKKSSQFNQEGMVEKHLKNNK